MRHTFILGGALAVTLTLLACESEPLAPEGEVAAVARGQAAAAAASWTPFTATDMVVGLIDPGTVELRARHLMMKGVSVRSRLESSDPRIAGFANIVSNGVLSLADGSGPVWGKFTVEADAGGTWEGTWTGRREQTGASEWTGTLRLVAHGRDGAVEGLKMKGTEIVTTYSLVPSGFVGQVQGYIRER